jgi:signal transduction histidine kinase
MKQTPLFGKTDSPERWLFSLHQILNSITLIRGYFELFTEDPQVDYKNLIESEIEHLSELIQQSMILERVSAQKQSHTSIPIKSFFTQIVKIFKSHGNQQSIKLELTPEIEKDSIQTHRFALEEILRILIDNAYKHGNNKSHSIFIKVEKTSKFFLVKVESLGIGISKKNQKKIFKPFTSLDQATGGCGIGLTIAQKIAQSQKMKLSVESDEKTYTCFTLKIPN